jgi:two-component system sensor histidine kinase CreC
MSLVIASTPVRTARLVDTVLARTLDVEIFGVRKTRMQLRVYITDAAGKVLYDSAYLAQGKDYSRWNDVFLTLKGRYGARSSRDDLRYPGVSVKYIAAPIRAGGKIVGVLTTGKPAVTLEQAIDATKEKILATILVVFAGFILTGFAVNYYLTRPIARIQAELDARKYIENFVQMLTHEFKTPVAGILGATEILERDPAPDDRRRFLANITREAGRIHRITDSLLTIATLENTRSLGETEMIDLGALARRLREDFAEIFAAKKISMHEDMGGISLRGNYFFLYQALANLLQNAADFSREGGTIHVAAAESRGVVQLTIDDTGTGIPDYAVGKIFTKFYSLERPDTGRKGTGLGLAFVEQVMKLHGGTIRITNRDSGGARVEMRFQM